MLSLGRTDTTESLDSLRIEWDELLERSDSDCVFLTHEWLATCWKHLAEGRRLHILTVRDGAQLVGILPVAMRGPQYSRMMPRMLEFIGSGVIGSDYLDVIVDPEREEEVLDLFARHLTTYGLMLQFGSLRRTACVAERLAQKLESRHWAVTQAQINVCPFIFLKGHSWESYMATLGSSQRYNVQRRIRNLEKFDGFRFEVARTPEQARPALRVLIDLHRKRWESRPGESEAFQSTEIVAFHLDFVQLAAQRGWLRILSLHVKDTPVAALYGLLYGTTFYFYQSGYDSAFNKQSVGLVMMGLAIKSAINESAAEFDLLHGDEEYKLHWTRETRPLARIELFPPYVRGRFYRHCVTFNRAARQAVRHTLTRS